MIGLICIVYTIMKLAQWSTSKQFPELQWWGLIMFIIGIGNMLGNLLLLIVNIIGGQYY